MESLFFFLLFLSSYSYAVYPATVYAMSRLLRNPWSQQPILPSVSLVISVYNEEKVIKEKIQNALSLDYPEGLLEIIVVSDGSTDRTNETVCSVQDPKLSLVAFEERSGKTACLNRVVPEAKGEIVFFTDANAIFPSDVLFRMTRNFSDANVGLVTGWTKYVKEGGEVHVTGLYSRIEKVTKHWESLMSSCVGADGAVFAIRKFLYRSLGDQDINDFITPLHIISQGKRAVLDPELFCFENSGNGGEKEFQRQARITNRTLLAIRRNPRFLNPFSYGLFSFFLLSHKILRFLVPFFVSGMFVINLLLLERSILYRGFLMVQLLVLIAGIAGILKKAGGGPANLCKFFLITLSAQFIGWLRVLRKRTDVLWIPQR
jgi:cellulose synthase/poly-beta-1,6-N-acetylglucosamine synthase-like glycosyltransferase